MLRCTALGPSLLTPPTSSYTLTFLVLSLLPKLTWAVGEQKRGERVDLFLSPPEKRTMPGGQKREAGGGGKQFQICDWEGREEEEEEEEVHD